MSRKILESARKSSLALAVLVVIAAGGLAVNALAGEKKPAAAAASLRDASGDTIGTVRLLPRADGAVSVRAEVESLPAGFHGFHVHEHGVCVPPFTSAGGHFNPGSASHGSHAGDMPVLLVNQDGSAKAQFETDRFRIEDLLDEDGSAIIVHESADNYANIPTRYSASGPDADTLATGDAGGRLACGVVSKH